MSWSSESLNRVLHVVTETWKEHTTSSFGVELLTQYLGEGLLAIAHLRHKKCGGGNVGGG
jgi:hypothetical protein